MWLLKFLAISNSCWTARSQQMVYYLLTLISAVCCYDLIRPELYQTSGFNHEGIRKQKSKNAEETSVVSNPQVITNEKESRLKHRAEWRKWRGKRNKLIKVEKDERSERVPMIQRMIYLSSHCSMCVHSCVCVCVIGVPQRPKGSHRDTYYASKHDTPPGRVAEKKMGERSTSCACEPSRVCVCFCIYQHLLCVC